MAVKEMSLDMLRQVVARCESFDAGVTQTVGKDGPGADVETLSRER